MLFRGCKEFQGNLSNTGGANGRRVDEMTRDEGAICTPPQVEKHYPANVLVAHAYYPHSRFVSPV